jgi:hypothetical protein
VLPLPLGEGWGEGLARPPSLVICVSGSLASRESMQDLLLAEGAMIGRDEKAQTLSRWSSILRAENSRSPVPKETDDSRTVLMAAPSESTSL